MAAEPAARSWLERDLDGVERVPVAGGEAAVWTGRCPGKAAANEDAALVLAGPGGRGVLAVADGVGGHAAGAQAARIAIETLARTVVAAFRSDGDVRHAIMDAFESANASVRELAVGAGTTLVVAHVGEESFRPYHVGDSQVLAVGQRGRRKHLTVPHSPVGYGVEAGLIDEKESLGHAERHVVTNALGSPDMHIGVGPTVPLAPRDVLLLASDGLFDNLTVDEVAERVRKGPLDEALAGLRDTCRRRMEAPREGEPSKPDDLTIVLWRRGVPGR